MIATDVIFTLGSFLEITAKRRAQIRVVLVQHLRTHLFRELDEHQFVLSGLLLKRDRADFLVLREKLFIEFSASDFGQGTILPLTHQRGSLGRRASSICVQRLLSYLNRG